MAKCENTTVYKTQYRKDLVTISQANGVSSGDGKRYIWPVPAPLVIHDV